MEEVWVGRAIPLPGKGGVGQGGTGRENATSHGLWLTIHLVHTLVLLEIPFLTSHSLDFTLVRRQKVASTSWTRTEQCLVVYSVLLR
jgi:hypothetical protein